MKTAEALKTDNTTFRDPGFFRLPPEAGRWIDHLRSAFMTSAAGRRDLHSWQKIEKEVTGMLARRLIEVSQMPPDLALQALERADQRLLASALSLLQRAERSGRRSRCFNTAALDIAVSKGFTDEVTTAFCRHAVLVWLTLWHLSDTKSVIPEDVNALPFAETESGASFSSGSAALERSPHILARTLKAAAAALRKADQGNLG